MNPLIESLRGKLIVSCQALPGNPLRDTGCIARLAEAAVQGGAAAIRANGVDDLAAIRARVRVPVIGINKSEPSPDIPYITPSFEAARQIAGTGVEIIALDATARWRPDGSTVAGLIGRIRSELGVLVMADISTLSEGLEAAEAGADLIATTLSGYTAYSPKTPGPDFRLIEELAERITRPVIAEGRFHTPEDVRRGLDCGAHAVVIGKMITNPVFITQYFINRMQMEK